MLRNKEYFFLLKEVYIIGFVINYLKIFYFIFDRIFEIMNFLDELVWIILDILVINLRFRVRFNYR